MKLNSTPKPMAKVATRRRSRKWRNICDSDDNRPPERTNCRSRGSISATMTAATSVISATTWMAERQPITSVRMPGMKRPENPPMLEPVT